MQHVSISAASALVLAALMAPSAAFAADVQKGRFTVDPKIEIAMPLGITEALRFRRETGTGGQRP